MKARVLKLMLATTAFAFTLAACSSNEEPAARASRNRRTCRLESGETHTDAFSLPGGTPRGSISTTTSGRSMTSPRN